MTRREVELLAFIERYRAETGYSPTYDEMSEALGTVKSNVQRIVYQLIDKGKLIKRPYRDGRIQARSLVPTQPVEVIRRALVEARKSTSPGYMDLRRMIDEAEAALEKLT